MSEQIEIQGLKELQDKLAAAVARVGAGPNLEGVVARATLRAYRYATAIVHVISGRLKNSLHPTVSRQSNTIYGVIGTNVVYARIEHNRPAETGWKAHPPGGHDFFARTIKEDGQGILKQARDDVIKGGLLK